jgi:hypothetical protein
MKRPATETEKGSAWVRVPLEDVVAIFEKHYTSGPLPTKAQCYHLANAIDIVRNSDRPPVKNAIPGYRNRQRVFDAIFKLVEEQIDNLKRYTDPRWSPLVQLEELRSALESTKSILIAAPNPLVGERRGAEWHWPAHFFAQSVEEALRLADRKKKYLNKQISRDKRGRFVLVVCDALELAGLEKPTPDAVAAVLQKPTI